MSPRFVMFGAAVFSIILAVVAIKVLLLMRGFDLHSSISENKETTKVTSNSKKSKVFQGLFLGLSENRQFEVEFPSGVYLVSVSEIIWPRDPSLFELIENYIPKGTVIGCLESKFETCTPTVFLENGESLKLSHYLVLEGLALCRSLNSECRNFEESARHRRAGIWKEIISSKNES